MEPSAQPCAAEVAWRHRALVAELKRKRCVQTAAVEAALRAVPRHLFVPHVSVAEAYGDHVISTKYLGQQLVSSASQPAMVALMLEQLALEPGQRVLEVGTGSGYNAALMAHMVGETGQVVSVELEADLCESARRHLAAADVARVRVVCGDGAAGHAPTAPYDRIMVTASANDLTPAWWDQLAPGGRLVVPFALRQGLQASLALAHCGDHFACRSAKPCMFMDLRGDAVPQERCTRAGDRLVLFGPDPGTTDVQALLEGPHRDLGSGVCLDDRDPAAVMALRIWLALQEKELVTIMSDAQLGLARYLDYFERYALSEGLVGPRALAVLCRQPRALTHAFEAVVRCYGEAEPLAQRLLADARGWRAAGCPNLNDYAIRVYRKGTAPALGGGDALVERAWTDWVFQW